MVKLWIKDIFAHIKQYGLCFLTSTLSICLVLVVSVLSSSIMNTLNQEIAKLGLPTTICQILSRTYSQVHLKTLLKDQKYTMLTKSDFEDMSIICCEDLNEYFPYEVDIGEPFDYLDNFKNSREILLGKNTYQYFQQPKIGETISLFGCEFLVKGVLKEGQSNLLFDYDDCVLMSQTYNFENQSVYVLADENFDEEILYDYLSKENVLLLNNQQISESFMDLESIIKIVFETLSLFSFFISSLGLLNFQKTILKQRKNEIGIKKSLGASPRDILFQFLFESILINILALIASIFIVSILTQCLNSAFETSLLFHISSSVIMILIISICIGLYPAYKASKVSIIEAIRF